jgi:hypothetical protein
MGRVVLDDQAAAIRIPRRRANGRVGPQPACQLVAVGSLFSIEPEPYPTREGVDDPQIHGWLGWKRGRLQHQDDPF